MKLEEFKMNIEIKKKEKNDDWEDYNENDGDFEDY